jgi:hypothetical protein
MIPNIHTFSHTRQETEKMRCLFKFVSSYSLPHIPNQQTNKTGFLCYTTQDPAGNSPSEIEAQKRGSTIPSPEVSQRAKQSSHSRPAYPSIHPSFRGIASLLKPYSSFTKRTYTPVIHQFPVPHSQPVGPHHPSILRSQTNIGE